MDTRTGEIISFDEFNKIVDEEEKSHFKEIKMKPTQKQLNKKTPQIGRNDLCPCGSGKKFKKCCLEK